MEAFLPGFGWLSVSSFMLGLVEAAFHNYFARRTDPNFPRVTPARAA